MKLGYLVSQYPARTHTFVLREVRALRSSGIEVCVVSVRSCDRPVAELSADEAEEAMRTFSVLGAGHAHAVIANLRVLCRHPLGYLRGCRQRTRRFAMTACAWPAPSTEKVRIASSASSA